MNLLSNSAFQRVCLLLFAAISSSISLAADCTPTSLSETDANAANAVFVRYKDMQPSQGAFKVSASKTVYFAKSNLQFGGCSVWRFAENAWDLGNGWTDLFNWATSGRYHSQGGMLGASKNYALGDDFNQSMTGTYQEADWGYYNTIINGSNASKRWTVLTKAEWEYLLNDTQIYGFATVNGVKGIILIPNAFDWTTSGLKYTKANFHHVKKDQTSGTTMTNALNNTLTAAQWKVFEDRGAVFLPDNNAMGAFLSGWWRPSSEACPLFTQAMCDQWTAFAANRGYYWTSSHASISGDYYYSHCLFFDNSNCELQTDYYPKNYFFSVRCVTTNKSTYATNNYGLDAQITNNTGGSITATFDATHRSCALKANVSSGYIFTHWMKGTTVFDASGSTEIPSTTVKAGDQYSAYFLKGTDVTSLRWFADGVGVSTTARNMQGAKAWIYIGGTLVKSNQAITQLDYGYYKVPIANLDNLSNAGKKLRIVFLNSCNEPVNVLEEDAVPVIVSGNKSFSTFITNATADNYLFTDIVVLNNAVFNMDVSISNFTFRYLRIYPGAKVILPTGTPRIYSYGVYMYADAVADSYPQLLKNNGTVLNYYNISYTTQWVDGQAVRVPVVQRNSNSPTLRLFYVLDYKLYYPLCLPVGHQLRYSYQAFRPELEIRYYDGAKRIAQETGWTVADHTTTSDGSHDLQAGKGYIVYAVPNLWNGNRRKKVIVTFGNTTAYLNSSGERNFNSTVLAAGDESVPPSERNWNLIGNPFLCNMGGEAASSDNIKLGYLRDVYGDGLWTDGTYYDEEVRYLTIPLNGFRKYRQLKASEAVVKPFNVFFVQTTGGGTVLFNANSRILNMPRKADSDMQQQEKTFGISLVQDSVSDRTGLLFGDSFTDQYDINADLEKMFGDEQGLALYCIHSNHRLAFCALPEQQQVSIGFSNAAVGQPMSISLDPDTDPYEWKSLVLTDLLENRSVDLLRETYEFVTQKTQDDSRFLIMATPDDGNPVQTPLEDLSQQQPAETVMFDLLGRKIGRPESGVYILIENGVPRKIVNR